MASYNRVIMMGNLTRDPEYKQLASGQSVCRLGLASNRQFRNRQSGEMVQEVCFIDIDVWGPQAESCNQYLQKGRSILVEGRIKLDSWQDNDGQRRSKHSIVADRVTFLSNAQTDTSANFEGAETAVSTEKMQTAAKTVAPATTVASKEASAEPTASSETTATGEISFKEKEPFEDDLPF